MPTATPLYGPPIVGGDILSFCSRCKMELAHVVVSMVAKRPAKVICKTCKSEHKYKGALSPAPRAPRKPSVKKTVVKASEYWESKLSGKHVEDQVPYSLKKVFLKGAVIAHSTFGVGIVEEVRSNGKISVMFREGEKLLVHGMT